MRDLGLSSALGGAFVCRHWAFDTIVQVSRPTLDGLPVEALKSRGTLDECLIGLLLNSLPFFIPEDRNGFLPNVSRAQSIMMLPLQAGDETARCFHSSSPYLTEVCDDLLSFECFSRGLQVIPEVPLAKEDTNNKSGVAVNEILGCWKWENVTIELSSLLLDIWPLTNGPFILEEYHGAGALRCSNVSCESASISVYPAPSPASVSLSRDLITVDLESIQVVLNHRATLERERQVAQEIPFPLVIAPDAEDLIDERISRFHPFTLGSWPVGLSEIPLEVAKVCATELALGPGGEGFLFVSFMETGKHDEAFCQADFLINNPTGNATQGKVFYGLRLSTRRLGEAPQVEAPQPRSIERTSDSWKTTDKEPDVLMESEERTSDSWKTTDEEPGILMESEEVEAIDTLYGSGGRFRELQELSEYSGMDDLSIDPYLREDDFSGPLFIFDKWTCREALLPTMKSVPRDARILDTADLVACIGHAANEQMSFFNMFNAEAAEVQPGEARRIGIPHPLDDLKDATITDGVSVLVSTGERRGLERCLVGKTDAFRAIESRPAESELEDSLRLLNCIPNDRYDPSSWRQLKTGGQMKTGSGIGRFMLELGGEEGVRLNELNPTEILQWNWSSGEFDVVPVPELEVKGPGSDEDLERCAVLCPTRDRLMQIEHLDPWGQKVVRKADGRFYFYAEEAPRVLVLVAEGICVCLKEDIINVGHDPVLFYGGPLRLAEIIQAPSDEEDPPGPQFSKVPIRSPAVPLSTFYITDEIQTTRSERRPAAVLRHFQGRVCFFRRANGEGFVLGVDSPLPDLEAAARQGGHYRFRTPLEFLLLNTPRSPLESYEKASMFLGGWLSLRECAVACLRHSACRAFDWREDLSLVDRNCLGYKTHCSFEETAPLSNVIIGGHFEVQETEQTPVYGGGGVNSMTGIERVQWNILRHNARCELSVVRQNDFEDVDQCVRYCRGTAGCRYLNWNKRSGSCQAIEEFGHGCARIFSPASCRRSEPKEALGDDISSCRVRSEFGPRMTIWPEEPFPMQSGLKSVALCDLAANCDLPFESWDVPSLLDECQSCVAVLEATVFDPTGSWLFIEVLP